MISFRESLSTITSLAFSEFILDVGSSLFESARVPLDAYRQQSWDQVDRLLDGFLDRCPDFKMVIRADAQRNQDEFRTQAKERFPLIAGRDCIRFETSLAIDEYQLSSWY